jgi:tetratricopeptide (TPR) repeat protein
MKEYEAALKSFQQALQLAPKHSLAWHGQGIVEARKENFEAALACFDRTLELDPSDRKAWFNRGNALTRLNRYQEAAESFNILIQHEPNNYRAWYNRGITLTAMRRYHDALSSLDTAVSINPECYYAWTYRGILLNRLYRFKDALLSFDQSLRYRTPNPNAWYGKASTYALQGKAVQAARWLRNAIAVNPTLYRVMVQSDPNFSEVLGHSQIQSLLNSTQMSATTGADSVKWPQHSALDDGPNSALDF